MRPSTPVPITDITTVLITGDSLRLSNQALNLPPSIRDRILQLTAHQFEVPVDQLTLTAAEPQDWNGCMGLAQHDYICSMIAILGWKATISDGSHRWVYHTDSLSNDIR